MDTDSPIEQLPAIHTSKLNPQDFSRRHDLGDKYGFEKAKVRLFRPDQQDILPLVRLRDDPHAREKMPELADMNDEDLIKWAAHYMDRRTKRMPEMSFAICNKQDIPQNIVYLYETNASHIDTAVEREFLPVSSKNSRVIEISFGKDPISNEKGLVSSGVRQVLLKVQEMAQVRAKSTGDAAEIAVVAFTKHNPESDRVLERSGFILKGNMDYESGETEEDKNNKFYVLDWNKLQEIFFQKSSENLLADRQP